MYNLQTKIKLGDNEFNIREKGDFRLILDCFEALNDAELSKNERVISSLIIFYEDINDIEDLDKFPSTEEAIKEMFKFFNCGQEEEYSSKNNYKLIDWRKDSQLVCSAVNKVAGQEIRALPYLHWWTFMGYYMGIGESALSTVVGIRHKMKAGKKLEKYENEFKRDNPQYFVWDSQSVEEKEAYDEVMALWNSGK